MSRSSLRDLAEQQELPDDALDVLIERLAQFRPPAPTSGMMAELEADVRAAMDKVRAAFSAYQEGER